MAVGAWAIETCRSPSAKAGVFWVFFFQQSCKWRMVPIEIFSVISHWFTFHCKPWFWKEDGGMRMTCSFFIVLIRTSSQKKGFWFRGARFHHVPGEPNKRWGNSRKGLGKVGVSRHDVENVNLTTCSHPSLCIRADSQDIGILFPMHLGYTWLYGRTLKTTVWTACNVSLLIELWRFCFNWFKTHMLQRWKKYQSRITTEICQLFPESIHIHTVSIGIP